MGNKKIAYFSAEAGLESEMPTYAGGLGILTGDFLKACADLGLPLVGVTLLYEKGNFRQSIKEDGSQTYEEIIWHPEDYMHLMENKVEVQIHGQPIKLNAWQYNVSGLKGVVPLYFLGSDNNTNEGWARDITSRVYWGDIFNRIYQNIALGVGGVRLLDQLRVDVSKYHLNEGHSAFLILELMKQGKPLEEIKELCTTTTHTPVDAGIDKFDYDKLNTIFRDSLFKEYLPANIKKLAGDDRLNMMLFVLNCSGYANAVSKRHAETASNLFERKIEPITNGVHSATWTSYSFQKLYDEYCSGWRGDAKLLFNAKNIPNNKIWDAHMTEKNKFIDYVNNTAGIGMKPEILTIGFARRSALWKRADLFFYDINELIRIGKGKLQFVLAGKAHPADECAKELLKWIYNSTKNISNEIKCVYLEDYDMNKAKTLVSGCDVWLSTPLPPLAACETSGMKASHNGVPNFSTRDGWWWEVGENGQSEDVTGWNIGNGAGCTNINSAEAEKIKAEDAKSLYEKLETKIIPLYYNQRDKFIGVMKNAISVNASFFNAHRMVEEYVEKAYKRRA